MHLSLTPTALAKAKALGVVAAALTVGGAGGMLALSQVSDTASSTPIVTSSDATTAPSSDPASPTPTVTPTASESARKAAKPVPVATGSWSLPPCPSDVKNHGAYVAGVAHSAPRGKGGEHGQWVSQAARSDCGKSAGSGEQPTPTESESPDSRGGDSHDGQSHDTHSPGTVTQSAGTPSAGPDIAQSSTSGKHKDGRGGH